MAGEKKSQAEIVAELLQIIGEKLKLETKGTLGDYIRLLQLQKEIEEEEPRDITVGWVDKLEEKSGEEDGGPSSL